MISNSSCKVLYLDYPLSPKNKFPIAVNACYDAYVWLKNNAEKFVKYDMSIITANEKSEAESILKQIKGNELTFEDAVAVKAQKIYCAPDGKLTTSYRYQLENILEDSSDFSKIAELKELGKKSDFLF